MTDTPGTTTINPPAATAAPLAPSVARVLAALHRLGQATAAGTAAEAGLGYSTTTPKLRTLENQGLAEPFRAGDGRTLWHLTDAGHAHAQQQAEDAGTQPATEPAADPATPLTPDREQHNITDDAPEHLDGTPAQAGIAGDTAAGIQQPAAPQCPAEGDGQPAVTTAQATPADADQPREHTADASPNGEPDTGPAGEADTKAAEAADPAAHPSQTGDATPDTGTGHRAPATADAPPAEPAAQASGRRASGTLRGAILDILEANPGQRYKVSELCKLINTACEGTGAKKAGGGAVVNAANKLVETGRAVLAVERPATFALADTGASPTA